MTMRKNLKRLLAFVLAVSMTMSLLTITAFADEKVLVCGYEEHEHTEECYERTLTCGLEETEGHTHTEDCLPETTRELTCGKEEAKGHIHGDECYTTAAVLACGKEETEGHKHSSECRTLICGKSASLDMDAPEQHQHDDSCWEYSCDGVEVEPHAHTDECYVEQKTLICEMEAVEPHTHTDECYTEITTYSCGLEETEAHVHTDACYTVTVICGQEEHTHTDECYELVSTVDPEEPQDDGIATIANTTINVSGTKKLTEAITTSGSVIIKGSGTIDASDINDSAIIVKSGTLTIDGNVTITGGKGHSVTNGLEKAGDFRVGGGVYVESGKLVLKNGTISGNTAQRGGGIFVNEKAELVMEGGSVSGNKTIDKMPGDKYAGEGGGIFVWGKATISGGKITNNTCNSKTDLGGGGLYVNNGGIATLINATVTNNTADGLGGGIAGCCHGEMSLVAVDGVALYGNTAKHLEDAYTHTDGTRKTAGSIVDSYDKAKSYGITNSDIANDFYTAGATIVSNYMAGGGSAQFDIKVGNAAVRRLADNEVLQLQSSEMDSNGHYPGTVVAMKANPTQESLDMIPKNGVEISGNKSTVHGGGIGCNGSLFFGVNEQNQIDLYILNFSTEATKQLFGRDLKAGEFTFGLYAENGTRVATVSNDANGKVSFNISGYGHSELVKNWDNNHEEKFIIKEDSKNDNNTTFDKSEYQVTVSFTKTTSSNTVKLQHTTGSNTNADISVTYNETTFTGHVQSIKRIKDKNGTTLAIPEDTGKALFVNEQKTGSLTINKIVTLDGKTASMEDILKYFGDDVTFSFTVQGKNNGIDVTRPVTLNKGNGFSATVENLPIGTYTVTETTTGDKGDFKWVSTNADVSSTSVQVTDGGTATFTATNKYEAKRIDLSIEKLLHFDGVEDTAGNKSDNEFAFTLSGTDIYGNQIQDQTVTLKAGDKGTFEGLTAGTYTITETGTALNDFTYNGITVSGATIISVSADKRTINFTLSDLDNYVNAGFAFTAQNDYTVNKVDLRITKQVELDDGTPESTYQTYVENKEFQFEITGVDPNGNPINFGNGTTRTVTITVNGKGYGEETLTDLPVGRYTVKEVGDNNIEHYNHNVVELTYGEQKTTDGTITVDLTNQDISGVVTVSAVNSYTLNHTDLSLEKVVKLNGDVNNNHDLVKNLYFVFEVTGVGLNGENPGTKTLRLDASNHWKQTIQNLPVGTYTVKEVKVPDVQYFHYDSTGYTLNGQTVQMNEEDRSIELVDQDSLSIVATNNYDINRTSFSVSKAIDVTDSEVNEANGRYFNDHQFTFTLELVKAADGFSGYQRTEYTITLNNNTATFSGLPVGIYKLTESGAEVTDYIWNGVSITDGTVTKNDDGSFTVDLTNQINGSSVEVTATNSYTLKKGSFGVTKTVMLDGEDYGLIPDGHQYTFFINGTDMNGKAFGKQITVGVGMAYYFNNVPYGTYTITELFTGLENYNFEGVEFTGTGLTKVGDNQWEFTINDSNNGTFAVSATNTYERKLDTLNVRKHISGNFANHDTLWDFTVALKSPADYVKLADSYTYTVTDVDGKEIGRGSISPLKDDDGNDLTVEIDGETYTVYGTIAEIGDDQTAHVAGLPVGVKYEVTETEAGTDGYYTSYDGRTGTVTEGGDNNVIVYNSKSRYTTVTVTKNWVNDRPSQRPDSIVVELYRNGTLYDTVELNADNNWTKTWTGLHYGSVYTVQEVNVPAGYVVAYGGNTSGAEVNLSITNTSEQDYTSFSVRKVWAGNDGASRPASVTVQLMANGAAYGEAVTLNAANDWAYTWTGLDAEADYTVTELAIPENYTVSYTANAREYVITNTWAPKTSLTVNKSWINRDGSTTAPEGASVTVTLTRNGESTGTMAVLNAANNWTFTFENLDAEDAAGNAYTYGVTEAAYAGYSAEYVRVSDGAVTITNRWDETTLLSTQVGVNKVWEELDGSRATAALPDSITVNLYRDGEFVSSAVLSAANGWGYVWTDLDVNGTYTVEEVEVEGWMGAIDRVGNSFTLTNVRDDTFDIPDDDTPLSDWPYEDIPDIEIPDDDVPLDDVPKTGDDALLGLWLTLAALSGTGLLALCFVSRKHEDIEETED